MFAQLDPVYTGSPHLTKRETKPRSAWRGISLIATSMTANL